MAPNNPPPGTTQPPDHANQANNAYEAFDGPTTPEGGRGQPQKTPRPTLKDGVQSIKPYDFLKLHQIPCAREGLMTGIGAGFAVGMGRYVVGAKAPKAANWAFGAFILGSVIQWEYCQAQRRKERAAMARVVEVVDRKQAEKKARTAEAVQLLQEAEAKDRQANKSWYKFW